MSESERGLERLVVWQKSIELAVWVYREIVPRLPKEEKYGLMDQIRRAVQSVPANIAEGYGRFYFQEAIRFCYVARGSLEETRSHLILAHRLGFIESGLHQQAVGKMEEVRRLLNGYISFLKQSKPGAGEPGYQVRDEREIYEIPEIEKDTTSSPINGLTD